jgi:hypothetical protein
MTITLRQRLRAAAAERLKRIESTMIAASLRVCEQYDTDIACERLMRLISGTQTKSLREQLITELANEGEIELTNLWEARKEDTNGDA